MIDILIFSKDRACQLDAAIRSIKQNIPQIQLINILYKYTNSEFEKGYDKLKDKYKDIFWYKENNFEVQTKDIISKFNQPYSICPLDDGVCINPVRDEELSQILEVFSDKVVTISLHHNRNITYCGSAHIDISLPFFLVQDKYLLWDWTKQNPNYDWGYPHYIWSIYKTNYFQNLLSKIHFSNPNSLEGEMNKNRNLDKPYLLSFVESKFFSVDNNLVKNAQSEALNHIYSVEELNRLFLEGNIINIIPLQGVQLNRIHGPISFQFIKE